MSSPRPRHRRAPQARRPTGWCRPSSSSTTPARCSWSAGWTTRRCTARSTTGRTTFWSRSRQEYWVKGETSGHRQYVHEVRLDCDGDTLLVKVDQEGPPATPATRTCFDDGLLTGGAAMAEPAAAGRDVRPDVARGLGGAALALAGATQPWAEATTRTPALRTVTADGTEVAALALPLALVALAAWGTVLVLRARGRRVVSILGAAASVGAAATVVATVSSATDAAAGLLGDVPTTSTTTTAWPYVTVVGALLSAVAFASRSSRRRPGPR